MARLTLDLSGQGGLVERYQGDINDTTATPRLRYLGGQNQMADGIYNPSKKYGYLSPSVNAFTTLTGTVAAPINAIIYDASDDILYMSEEGENILKLDGLDDTSLSNYTSVSSGLTIKDLILYEITGVKSLFFIVDSGQTLTSSDGTGMYVGFKSVDTTLGLVVLDGRLSDTIVESASIADSTEITFDGGNGESIRLAQSFSSDDVPGLKISSVKTRMRRSEGSGSYNIQCTVQSDADPNAGIYTSQGAWSASSVSYAVNDTVTHGGSTWQCYSAHTSDASTEPGVGGSYLTAWNEFGSPDGTPITNGTSSPITASTIKVGSTEDYDDVTFQFTTPVDLTAGTRYWLVFEEVSGMTASDSISMVGSDAGSGTYSGEVGGKILVDAATDYWYMIDATTQEQIDFQIIDNEIEGWSKEVATGKFGTETGQDSFFFLGDNSILYWFVGNKVHTLDGSAVGGSLGRVVENVLSFPSYTSIPDVAETRSRMYIAVQTSNKSSNSDKRAFTAYRSGIFVWDRRSQILGGTDFFPCPGAKEIKALFTSSEGDVRAITVGNNGFTEIRAMSGNQFKVIQTLGTNAFPVNRKSISQNNHMTTWLGYDGIFYGYGRAHPTSSEGLFKLGDMSGEANAGLVTGPIFNGHEYSSNPLNAIIFGWQDSDPSYVVQKWYPYGEGTLDSVTQTAATGNVYSTVQYLPFMSTLKSLTIYCAPTDDADESAAATIKLYKNQKLLPFSTKTVRVVDINKGYERFNLNEPYCNAIQIEIEFANKVVNGADEFNPSIAILEYEPTETRTPDNG